MHIPPYYKRKSWQRFFAGVFIGMVVAFVIFMFMYGKYSERWIEENMELHSKLNQLQYNYNNLTKDKEELDRKSKEQLTISSIEIELLDTKKLKLDRLIIFQLKDLIKQQLQTVIGKDLETVYKNRKLVESTIENKQYVVDDFTYSVRVEQLTIYKTLYLSLKVNIYDR